MPSVLALLFAVQQTIQVDTAAVAFVLGSLVPFVTGIVSHLEAPAWFLAVVNFALSVVVGVGTAFQTNNGSLTWQQIATATFAVFIASGVSYNHLWKPTGLADAVQNKTAGIGVGPVQPPSGVGPDQAVEG